MSVHLGMILAPALLLAMTFVVALAMLHSVARALTLGATFTAGVLAGAALATVLATGFATMVIHVQPREMRAAGVWLLAALVGAGGGGVLAVYLLGRFSKYPPWRRY